MRAILHTACGATREINLKWTVPTVTVALPRPSRPWVFDESKKREAHNERNFLLHHRTDDVLHYYEEV